MRDKLLGTALLLALGMTPSTDASDYSVYSAFNSFEELVIMLNVSNDGELRIMHIDVGSPNVRTETFNLSAGRTTSDNLLITQRGTNCGVMRVRFTNGGKILIAQVGQLTQPFARVPESAISLYAGELQRTADLWKGHDYKVTPTAIPFRPRCG